MTIDVKQLRADLGLDVIEEALKAQSKAAEQEEARKANAAREAAEEKRMADMVAKATASQQEELKAAYDLIKEFGDAKKTSDADFAKKLEDNAETISGLQDSIKQLLAARDNTSIVGASVKTALMGDQKKFEEEVERVVLLGYITSKGMFDTAYGKEHLKAVNTSSSMEVSSEAYETIFSQRILKDIEAKLVIGNMFDELPMTSANLTMMVEPESGEATWVDASTYGTTDTTGKELKGKLSEINFRTFKLAAKSFITDETTEDAIVALLPILRRRLIDAHAKSIEKAFLLGDGNGKPTGLVTFAKNDKAVFTTSAKADGSVTVTAKDVTSARRLLGRKGLDLSKLALVISMDAYYDLLTDEEWQDVAQVGNDAVKLSGQVGRIYGLPVVVSEYFDDKAAGSVFGVLVYRENFVAPRQRQVTVERERQAERQRDAYYVTQRVNLQRFFENGVVAIAYAA